MHDIKSFILLNSLSLSHSVKPSKVAKRKTFGDFAGAIFFTNRMLFLLTSQSTERSLS